MPEGAEFDSVLKRYGLHSRALELIWSDGRIAKQATGILQNIRMTVDFFKDS